MSQLMVINESMTNVSGMTGLRASRRPAGWEKKLADFLALAENHAGHATPIWQAKLYESVTSADFPALYADTIDRELLVRYKAIAPIMQPMMKMAKLTSFRDVKRFLDDGGVQSLQEVDELAPYLHREKTASEIIYGLKKYGRLTGFSWEAFINDDLDFFSQTSQDLAESAANTKERLLAGLFFDADGPREDFFNVSKGQGGVSALPLTRTNLEIAIQEMMGTKADGTPSGFRVNEEPILNVPRWLVVPPQLQLTAEEILSDAALISGTSARNTSENILARRSIQIIVNPWLSVITTTGTVGNTQWALFSETIKAGEMGLLTGHEDPELFMKVSGAAALGGGASDPFSGSFEDDSITFKVRMVQGQTQLDPRGGWASDGQ